MPGARPGQAPQCIPAVLLMLWPARNCQAIPCSALPLREQHALCPCQTGSAAVGTMGRAMRMHSLAALQGLSSAQHLTNADAQSEFMLQGSGVQHCIPQCGMQDWAIQEELDNLMRPQSSCGSMAVWVSQCLILTDAEIPCVVCRTGPYRRS